MIIKIQAKSFNHRSWQFQCDDWEYLKEAIPLAKNRGMNRIQLSHDIIMDAEELWEDDDKETLALVRKCIALAQKHDLKVDMWTHEFSSVPDKYIKNGRIRVNSGLWEWLHNKYERVFNLLPELDGLVLTFAETDYEVYKGSKIEKQEKAISNIVQLSEHMHEICNINDKIIILRTFVHFPRELDWIGTAFSKVCDKLADSGNIVIMSKIIPHDWHPYYPYSPMLGKFDNVPQIVELDLGNEYTGKNYILYPMVDYISEALNYSMEHKIDGAVGRVEREQHLAIGTPNQINIYAFSKMVNGLDLQPEQIWNEWCQKQYGKEVVTELIPVLKRFYDITNITLFPLMQWLYMHTTISDYPYALKHLTRFDNYSIRRWIPAYHYQYLYEQKRYPTPDTFLKIEHEKNLARKLLERSQKDLELIRNDLEKEDYKTLKHYFDLSALMLEIYKHHSLSFFKMVRYENIKCNNQTKSQECSKLESQILKHCDKLDLLANKLKSNYSADFLDDNANMIYSYIKDLHGKLNGKSN